jgi:hypothetical protein
MPTEVSLKLVADNSQAVKSVKELNTESQKLYTNNEKGQKRQIGLIADVEKELGKLQTAQKNAMTLQHIEKYNQKIAEAKKALDEYNKAGLQMEKQTESNTAKLTKWAAGLGLIAGLLNELKKSFKDTVLGIESITAAQEIWTQMTYNVVTANATLNNGLAQTIAIAKQVNELRKKERVDMVDIAKAQRVYNELYFAASDRRRTDTERIQILDQALIAHNVAVDKEIENLRERQVIVYQQLAIRPKSNKLLDEEAQLNVQLENAEASRWAGVKRIESLRTGMIQEGIENRKKLAEAAIADNLEYWEKYDKWFMDMLEKDISKEKKFWEDYDKWFNSRLDKQFEDEKKAKDEKFDFEMKTGKLLFEQNQKAAKEAWDAMIKDEEDATKEQEELRNKRIDALKDGLNELLEFTQSVADREVQDAQRRRELFDTRISETQAAIQQEIELYKAGYASNVAAKQKELDELKKKRELALAEEEKAIAKQRALENIAQGVNLFTSATQILKTYTKFGPVGLALAAASITAMFSIMAGFKKKSVETVKLARGGHGQVNGRLHSQGGERFLDHVEIEQGEHWGVLSRSASRKYGKVFGQMVDSFNKDKLRVQGMTINNIAVQNDGPNKRLDQVNNNLREIKNKEEVMILNGMTIYKKGNTTRIIKCR